MQIFLTFKSALLGKGSLAFHGEVYTCCIQRMWQIHFDMIGCQNIHTWTYTPTFTVQVCTYSLFNLTVWDQHSVLVLTEYLANYLVEQTFPIIILIKCITLHITLRVEKMVCYKNMKSQILSWYRPWWNNVTEHCQHIIFWRTL